MAIQPQMLVDSSRAQASMRAMARAAGVQVRDVVNDQMRLAMVDMIRFTYPRNRAQGTRRIVGDMARLFTPVPAGFFSYLEERRDTDRRDPFVHRTRDGALRRMYKAQLVDDRTTLAALHRRQRRQSNGRTKRALVGGDLMYGGRAVSSDRNIRAVTRAAQSRVGFLKAGWVPAARHFARLSNGPVRIPLWVSKHTPAGTASGSGIGTGYRAVAANRVRYAARKIQQSLINIVLSRRRRDIVNSMQKRADRLAAQFHGGGST